MSMHGTPDPAAATSPAGGCGRTPGRVTGAVASVAARGPGLASAGVTGGVASVAPRGPGLASAGVTAAARCVLRRGDVDDAEPVKLLPHAIEVQAELASGERRPGGVLPLRPGPGGLEDPGHLVGRHAERAVVIGDDGVAWPDQLATDTDRHVDRPGGGLHGALGANRSGPDRKVQRAQRGHVPDAAIHDGPAHP